MSSYYKSPEGTDGFMPFHWALAQNEKEYEAPIPFSTTITVTLSTPLVPLICQIELFEFFYF